MSESDQENITEQDAALNAQLRLFCRLMLGSTDAADCMLQQIYRRALDHPEQENRPSKRVHLFRIAAGLCGVRR
jgi:DNA-directed RNA polymerase specialized sigma24 family protein